MTETIGLLIIGIIALSMIGMLAMIVVWYKKPTPAKALIRTGSGGMQITFDKGIIVIPTLHKMTEIDISSKEYNFEFSGENALISKDGEKLEVRGQFVTRINLDFQSIHMAIMSLGVERINDSEQFNSHFKHKFTDGILITARGLDCEEILANPEDFKVKIINTVGTDLNGVVLDDLVITKLSKAAF